MTNELQDSYEPLLYGSGLSQVGSDPYDKGQYRMTQLPIGHPLRHKVYLGEYRVNDLRRGYRPSDSLTTHRGDFSAVPTGDTRFNGHFLLDSIIQSFSNTMAPAYGVWSQAIGSSFYLAGGNGNGSSLFLEDASGFPASTTLTAGSYNPGGNISGLASVVIGGATSAERLVVLREAAAAQVMTNTSTVAGTMAAATNPGWGILTSPLNAATPGTGTLLIYAGTSIFTQPITAAITDALASTALSNVPGGGSAIGIEKLINGPFGLRAFWFWPAQSRTTSRFNTTGPLVPGRIVHTNLEGTDPQPVPYPFGTNRVVNEVLWKRHIVATDGFQVFAFDGDVSRDLEIFNNRPANSDSSWQVGALGVRGDNLFAKVYLVGRSGVFTAPSWIEQYNPAFNSWLPVSGGLTYRTGTSGTFGGTGIPDVVVNWLGPQMPISPQSGLYYELNGLGTTSESLFIENQEQNPFNSWRRTGNNATQYYKKWATTGRVTSPVYSFPPPVVTHPTVLYEIDMTENDIAAGGNTSAATAATVKLEVASQTGTSLVFTDALSATFDGMTPLEMKVERFDYTEAFNLFQFRLTVNQGTDTNDIYKSPNGAPVSMRFLHFLDGIVRRPSEVLKGWVWK